MRKLLYLLTSVYLVSLGVSGQNAMERGFPAINNFSPKEYDAFRQNWVIAQDNRGLIYVGNTDGLLEFDGNEWQLHTVPNKSAILGMDFSPDGKLFVGAQAELGYFFPDNQGKLTFTSLLKYLPEDKRDFSNVTETFFSQGKVYFNTEKHVLIWDIENEAFEILSSENGFHILFKVDDTIYVREWEIGLKVLKNGTLNLLEGGDQFASERIYSILPFPGKKGDILIVTRTLGLFKYDDSGFTPFKTEIDQFIKENLIYLPGTVLQDGNILLGTLNGGVILIDGEGKEVGRYSHEDGIINNTVYYTFQDRSGGIWLATENGISRIDYSSPISYFDSRSKIPTYSHDIIRHQGIIYAATADGIYTLDPITSKFNHFTNFNKQSWSFLEADNDLLVGTSDGLFKIESTSLLPLKKTIGNEFIVNELIQSRKNPSRIFIGVNSGIWSMVKKGKDWVEEGQILEVFDQPTSLAEDKEGNVWMGTFSNGVFKVNFPNFNEPTVKPTIENFGKEHGLQDGIVYSNKVNEEMYFGTTDSIYQFNETQKRFFVDPSDGLISTFYDLGAILDRVPLRQDVLGRVWLGNKKKIAVGEFNSEGEWHWNTFPFRRISDEAIYAIYAEKNGVTWFASGEGFIRYDYGKNEFINPEFPTLIREVLTGNDSVIFYGGEVDNLQIPEIKFKNTGLKFKYSATSFERKDANQFSTFLEGFEEDWSSWSLETSKAYTNLAPGEYTFHVKSVNSLGEEGLVASYPFVILPPWYRTWWAYLIYIFAISSVVYGIVQIRSFYLKKENRILDEKVQHRTRQLKKSLEDLKATQAQLVQSEKMASLGELTAGIAHEIQNPLNFVNNFSEVSEELIEEAQTGAKKGEAKEVESILDELKANLSKINLHGKRADAIVKSMLEHSKRGSGSKEPTNLNALADEFLRISYQSFLSKVPDFVCELVKQLDSNLPMVSVIPQDIGKVLMNLLNNAFYACAEKVKSGIKDYKPEVILKTTKVKNGIEISVQDNGNGILESIKDKIFQPFFTTKPTGTGTGLGLSLSYDIVKAHGGELTFESKNGEGTTFRISLPTAAS